MTVVVLVLLGVALAVAVAFVVGHRRRPVDDEVIDLRERLADHVDLDDRRVEAELGLDR